MIKMLLALSLLVLPAGGQNAKVVQLSPTDAAQAKELYTEKEAIDKKIEDLRTHIRDTYLAEKTVQFEHNSCICLVSVCKVPSDKSCSITYTKDGWGNGFSFSEDFKFIVPNVKAVDNQWIYNNVVPTVSNFTNE